MATNVTAGRKKYVRVVGPRLARLLSIVFALFALLMVNAVYLLSITIAGVQYQNWFYLVMFIGHLVLGLAIILPVVIFGAFHIKNARNRPNKRAIRVGYALFTTACILLFTGVALMFRLEVNQPVLRSVAYWLHVITPLVAVWLFVLHRLAGRRIKWKVGLSWAAVAAAFAGAMLIVHKLDPRAWNQEGPKSGEQYFFPSLARTSTGQFIPENVLDNSDYCMECHQDIHESWAHSVHKFSSFNNPPYLFSVRETRQDLAARDGNVQASRFCAGCHDPVPFFSGAFDDPKFDDPNYDLSTDATAQAGITCTVCHSISHVNSVRGNADYTITEPMHYPFAFSDNPALKWINRQLIKAKPEFHKATFLKPLHQTTEFCGTCHKVHLPVELNDYKWLRGQNHFDAFWTSGVSGQGIASFYYPPQAETNCNGCHMPLIPAGRPGLNFASRIRDDSGILKTLDHQFPSANTAIPHMLRDQMPDADAAIAAHADFMQNVPMHGGAGPAMRVDIFGIREDGAIDGELHAPLRPDVPTLTPGETYLFEVVIRTLKMGHLFTQGTADSNEVWMDITVTSGDRVIGRSGGMDDSNAVDPWSHFINAFVIDRNGDRINRRNAEDIFIALYNNQIPPGAADVMHCGLTIPADVTEPITVRAELRYRKFDTEYMRLVMGDPNYVNDLPIMTLATDEMTFAITPSDDAVAVATNEPSEIIPWQRWNDYGIALFRKGQLGQLRQAREAFEQVEQLGRPDGPLNLARMFIKEGLIQSDAPEALRRAAEHDPPAHPWSLLWFGAQVAAANGDHAKAATDLQTIVTGGLEGIAERGFDFSKDYNVRNALANALYQLALREDGDARTTAMQRAASEYEAALLLDPENLAAHYGLRLIFADLGDTDRERFHSAQHAKYKPDDNAADQAVAAARVKYPAANHAAEDVVIYDLQRPDAYGR